MNNLKIKKLFNTLKKTEYSKKHRLKFRNLVNKLEYALECKKNRSRGVWEYKITPIDFFLRYQHRLGKKVAKKYLKTVNTSSKFIVKKYLLKKGVKIIPVHITNKVKKKGHLNLLVIKNKNVYRIDPSYSKITKIKEKNVKKALIPFFKKYSLKYRGIYKNTKLIIHGGLCRFVTPMEFFHKNINYSIIKREIIKYFKYLMKKNKINK